MKHLLVTLLLLVTLPSIAQTVGKIQYMSLKKVGNNHIIEYTDFNQRRTTKKKIEIDNVEKLYNTIMNGFDNMSKKNVQLSFNNDTITLKYKKSMGVVSMRIFHSNKSDKSSEGMTRFLTKFQLMQLFDKEE